MYCYIFRKHLEWYSQHRRSLLPPAAAFGCVLRAAPAALLSRLSSVPAIPTLSPLAMENCPRLRRFTNGLNGEAVPTLGGHLGGPHLGVPFAGPIVRAIQVDGATIAGPLLQVVWIDPVLTLAFASTIFAISWLMRTVIASTPCAFFQSLGLPWPFPLAYY